MSELKPGVLVMCKGGTPNLAHREFAGSIRRVGHCVCVDYLGAHWRLDPPTMAGTANLQWTHKYLQIIADPGDDARDESNAWLPPVPTKVGQPA